jgi:hypothetical protein
MNDWLSWFATAATIGGALLTASNLGARITGTGFVVFLFGSLSWIGISLMSGQQALFWTNIVLTFLNLFGIWRWLGRQAAVDKGAKAATEASEKSPSETLFRASLFTNGKIFDSDGEAMATCVDGMLDERSGRPRYLVISEGGVAGAGETLRRLPWSEVAPREDGFSTALIAGQLARCDIVDRSHWPAR